MCVGAPVRVIDARGATALCEGAHGYETIDLSLVGVVQHGDWLLTHVGVAIRCIDALEARQIADALEAVRRATAGAPFDHLLADLINREPQLPEHLRSENTA